MNHQIVELKIELPERFTDAYVSLAIAAARIAQAAERLVELLGEDDAQDEEPQ